MWKLMWIMVAGPYRTGAKSDAERAHNLRLLNLAAHQIFLKGHVPIIGVNLALPIIAAAGEQAYEIFTEALGDQFPYDEIRKKWRQYTEEYIAEFGVAEKRGLRELLAFLQMAVLPRAVATSTIRVKALALLQQSNLLHHFVTVVGGDEVSAGKPDPAIFLAVAKRLNVEPDRCLVLEDSAPGIQAAHAAGMIPVLVPDAVQPTPETLAQTYRVCDSLSDAIEFSAPSVRWRASNQMNSAT